MTKTERNALAKMICRAIDNGEIDASELAALRAQIARAPTRRVAYRRLCRWVERIGMNLLRQKLFKAVQTVSRN